ncbi:imidazole glycerol phosphate synthase subunit HisF [Candidatus Woesearchaeota archaeon]|mgnify:CR=1 FL=1|nr:MAG: imidazole glycerol phosphate synthase subunit HisF [Candidatus Woesearchaeota archaeon]
MLKIRVIPCLLLKGLGLVKTVQFKNPRYIGDPINAVRIFNEKEADELIFLDITASEERRVISLELVSKIAEECFMPFCVGGGIRTLEDIKQLLGAGAEKVAINTFAIEHPGFIKKASTMFGAQSIVVSIDAKRRKDGSYEVYTCGGKNPTGLDPLEVALRVEKNGAGEILLNSIDKDGTMEGYDIELIKSVARKLNIPVIACGGAGKLEHFYDAVKNGGASAVAAGSLFVYHGPRRAVLINYPSKEELEKIFR